MDEIIDILEEMHPDVDFMQEKKLIDNKILDSFDIVTLIAELSNAFDVSIPAEEIIPENFNSVMAIHQMIERLEDED